MTSKNFLQTFAIILLIILGSTLVIRIYPPIASFDTYFHLAVGREVTTTHRIPTRDNFTFISDGRPWISNEWLSGLIFYFFYSNFAENGILALRAISMILTLTFMALTLKTLKINFILVLLTLLTVALALSTRIIDRPEMFSFVFFSILIYIMTKYHHGWQQWKGSPTARTRPFSDFRMLSGLSNLLEKGWGALTGRKLLTGPAYVFFLIPIFILWPNIQGYAPIGVAVLIYYTALIILPQKKNFSGLVFAAKKHKFLLFTLLASSLVSFLQFKRFLYFMFLNPVLFNYVSEVRSIAASLDKIKYNQIANIPIELHIFFIFTLVALLSFLAIKPHTSSKTLLTLVYSIVLCGLAFKYTRVIPLFVLLTAPIVASNFNDSLKRKAKYLLAPIAIIILVMAFSIYRQKLIGERHNTLYIFDKNNFPKVATSQTWKERKPTAALEFIEQNFAPQKLITSLNWSNQTIWQLNGKTKVLIDIIYEKQTETSFQDHLDLASNRGNIAAILNTYDPDIVITTQPETLATPFEPAVYKLNNWHLVYVDELAKVYAKANNHPELKLAALHPESTADLKFNPREKDQARSELKRLLEVNPSNAFAASQLILLLILEKNYPEAEALARSSTELFPQNPTFYLLLAQLKITAGNCYEAKKLIKIAKSQSRGYFYLQDQAAELRKKCPD